MDFLQTYFIDPIKYNTGYNIVNTSVYAVLLVAAVVLAYRLLKKINVPIDKNFLFGIAPFIALGGLLRAWEDLLEATGATDQLLQSPLRYFVIVDSTGTARNALLISPVMYATVFVIALSALLLSMRIKKWPYHKSWFAIGFIVDLAVLSQLRFVDFFAMAMMLGIAAFWCLAVFAAKKFTRNKKIHALLTAENSAILGVHMFDASTTFVAIQFFSYFEQHVLPGFLISVFGPAVMFPLKLAVVGPVLFYLDKEKDVDKKNFIKIAILILGLGPGLRNFLRLAMGV